MNAVKICYWSFYLTYKDPRIKPKMSSRRKKPVLLILIHGIRTHADWQYKIPGWIDADESIVVKSPGYGYFDAFRFWFPFFTRNGPIKKISRELDDILPAYPEKDWDRIVIAHSFGTYTITNVLQDRPAWKFSDIILCGSIVSKDFRWTPIANQIQEGGRIVNEVGALDVWPAMAKAWSWGYGSTGTYGMKSGQVDDRIHQIGHSEFFTEEFARKYWKPIIHDRKMSVDNSTQAQIKRPWWFSILDLPLGALSIIIPAILFGSLYFFNPFSPTNSHSVTIEPINFNGSYSEEANTVGNGFLGQLLINNRRDYLVNVSNVIFLDKNRNVILLENDDFPFVCFIIGGVAVPPGDSKNADCISGSIETDSIFSVYPQFKDKVCFIRFEYTGYYTGNIESEFKWVDAADC